MSVPLLTSYFQGQGAGGADDWNTLTRSGALLGDLQAFIGLQNMTVYMLGYTAVGDGGQGLFYWNSSFTGTSDNINSIQPYGIVQGAWIRVPDNPAQIATEITAFFLNLPTTPPTTENVVWLNQGAVCVSRDI